MFLHQLHWWNQFSPALQGLLVLLCIPGLLVVSGISVSLAIFIGGGIPVAEGLAEKAGCLGYFAVLGFIVDTFFGSIALIAWCLMRYANLSYSISVFVALITIFSMVISCLVISSNRAETNIVLTCEIDDSFKTAIDRIIEITGQKPFVKRITVTWKDESEVPITFMVMYLVDQQYLEYSNEGPNQRGGIVMENVNAGILQTAIADDAQADDFGRYGAKIRYF